MRVELHNIYINIEKKLRIVKKDLLDPFNAKSLSVEMSGASLRKRKPKIKTPNSSWALGETGIYDYVGWRTGK
jgi:hypothetical protein